MISGFRPESGSDVESRSALLFFIPHNCLFFPFIKGGINWSSAVPMAKSPKGIFTILKMTVTSNTNLPV